LETTATAPARNAASTAWRCSEAETTMMVAVQERRDREIASTPATPGKPRSRSTRSGVRVDPRTLMAISLR